MSNQVDKTTCCCGTVHLPNATSVEIGGVYHRSDGPCYHVEAHQEATEPSVVSAAQERATEVLRDYFGRPLPNEGTCHAVVYGAWRYGSSNRNSLEICEALGIDPEMPVTELRRLLQAYEGGAS